MVLVPNECRTTALRFMYKSNLFLVFLASARILYSPENNSLKTIIMNINSLLVYIFIVEITRELFLEEEGLFLVRNIIK